RGRVELTTCFADTCLPDHCYQLNGFIAVVSGHFREFFPERFLLLRLHELPPCVIATNPYLSKEVSLSVAVKHQLRLGTFCSCGRQNHIRQTNSRGARTLNHQGLTADCKTSDFVVTRRQGYAAYDKVEWNLGPQALRGLTICNRCCRGERYAQR